MPLINAQRICLLELIGAPGVFPLMYLDYRSFAPMKFLGETKLFRYNYNYSKTVMLSLLTLQVSVFTKVKITDETGCRLGLTFWTSAV